MKPKINPSPSLALGDVILLPRRAKKSDLSDIGSIDLSVNLSESLCLNLPVLSAAMDTITESRTAIVMARAGGAGVIHKNLPPEVQVAEVDKVKREENIIIPGPKILTLFRTSEIKQARMLKKSKGISSFPVIDNAGFLLGILTKTDIRSAKDDDEVCQHMTSLDVNSQTVIVADSSCLDDAETLLRNAESIFQKRKIEKIPIIDKGGKLIALITYKDFEKRQKFPNAAKDSSGRLIVGAAVSDDCEQKCLDHITNLMDAGLDFLVVDKAHGDTCWVTEAVKTIKCLFPALPLVVGNVVTGIATLELFNAGADVVKVGIGAGSICTTREVTGTGRGQFSAIIDCADIANQQGKSIIADGGIRSSGDIVKALAAGAKAVMVGRLFAATEETPGSIIEKQGGARFKVYRGMGSKSALQKSPSRYVRGTAVSIAPEGVECELPLQGKLEDVLSPLVGGVRQGMWYQGSPNIAALQENPYFEVLTLASAIEGRVHDIENIIG